jgi:hypothetical protein
MLLLDLRILVCIPFALSEVFLIWTLWNLLQQSRKKKSRTSSRLASDSQPSAPATAQVFSFPHSSSAAPTTMSRAR